MIKIEISHFVCLLQILLTVSDSTIDICTVQNTGGVFAYRDCFIERKLLDYRKNIVDTCNLLLCNVLLDLLYVCRYKGSETEKIPQTMLFTKRKTTQVKSPVWRSAILPTMQSLRFELLHCTQPSGSQSKQQTADAKSLHVIIN